MKTVHSLVPVMKVTWSRCSPSLVQKWMNTRPEFSLELESWTKQHKEQRIFLLIRIICNLRAAVGPAVSKIGFPVVPSLFWATLIIFHCVCVCVCVCAQSCLTLCRPMDYSPATWNFLGQNAGVSCHFLLEGIFPAQGLNLHLLDQWADSLPLSHLGSPQQHSRF